MSALLPGRLDSSASSGPVSKVWVSQPDCQDASTLGDVLRLSVFVCVSRTPVSQND